MTSFEIQIRQNNDELVLLHLTVVVLIAALGVGMVGAGTERKGREEGDQEDGGEEGEAGYQESVSRGVRVACDRGPVVRWWRSRQARCAVTVTAKLDIRSVTPSIGAEIHGLDCSVPFDAETLAAVRAAWLEHLVLFFPDQSLTPNAQVMFASQFGEVTEGHPVEPSLDEHPQVLPIDSIKDRTNFWHTDVTFMSKPPTGSILYAVTVPDAGGDTMWANTRAAYDTLAEPLQQMCDHLIAIHYDQFYAEQIAQGAGKEWEGRAVERLWPVEHPVVRVHPETGRKNLFVNPQFTVGVKGFDGPQANALLRLLYDHMIQPRFVVRYRWRPGTLGFWDNRTTMHYGIYDYGDERRIMHRVTLKGEPPTATR